MSNLVLLPGMDGTGELFRDFAESLSLKFKTQIVSYPTDHTLSYRELILFLQSAIRTTEPFVLVAESFSTPLAIQYAAATTPSNLRGIVLCVGFASSPVSSWLQPFGYLLAPFLTKTPPDPVIRFLLTGSDAPPSLVAAVRHANSQVRPEVLSARLRTVLSCDARSALRQIAVPMLYLQAKQDRLIRPSSLKEIQTIKPQVELASLAGPHLILQREPEKTSRLVAAFAQRCTDFDPK